MNQTMLNLGPWNLTLFNLRQPYLIWALNTLLALAFTTTISIAQCGVLLGDDAPPSRNENSSILYPWDFDGDGPLPPELLLGSTGGRVMAFNGQRWRQVGQTLPRPYDEDGTSYAVTHFLNFQDSLHAFVSGNSSGDSGDLYRWENSAWNKIPNYISITNYASGWLLRGTVHKNKIVVAGHGCTYNGAQVPALTWDGTKWAALMPATQYVSSNSIISAAYSTSDGRLLIGGQLFIDEVPVLIAEILDGQWILRVLGTPGEQIVPVTRFQEIDGHVYAVTSSVQLTGQPPSPIGVLREDPSTRTWSPWVRASDVNATILTGGELAKIENTWYFCARANQSGVVFKREGETGPWTRCEIVGGSPSRLRTMMVFQDEIIAAGMWQESDACAEHSQVYRAPISENPSFQMERSRFVNNASNNFTPHLSGVLAADGEVHGWYLSSQHNLTHFGTASLPPTNTASCEISTGNHAFFDGYDWRRDAEPLNGDVTAMIEYMGEVLAFGNFSRAGSRDISPRVARRVNGRWESLGGGDAAGLPVPVSSATVHQGQLFAASHSLSSTQIYTWDGFNWVRSLATLPIGSAQLVSTDDELFVYGLGSQNIARLEANGTQWSMLPQPQAPINDAVSVGGTLAVALQEYTPTSVKILVDDTWVTHGVFPRNATIRSLCVHQGELFAGAQRVANMRVASLSVLQSNTWVPAITSLLPASGIQLPFPSINDLHSSGDTLHIVGSIGYLGGQHYENWARYYSGPPRILTDATSTQVVTGRTAYFSIEPEVYHDPNQRYQWMRVINGVNTPLANGTNPAYPRVSGAKSPYLRIDNTTAADSGEYYLLITNNCGETLSQTATLTVRPPPPNFCPADFNQDGGVNGDDIEAFFLAWESADPLADINLDSGIDGTDIQAFFTLWEAGGC